MKTRSELINKVNALRASCLQVFIDVEHWNTFTRKPEEAIIKADPDGKLSAIIKGVGAMMENESKIKQERLRRLRIE